MKNFKHWLLGLLCATVTSPCLAVPILAISPTHQTYELGDTVHVDVMLREFQPDFVGAFDFTVTWDPTLLSLGDLAFSTALGGSDVIEGFSGGSGSVSAFQVALGDVSHQAGFGEMRLFSLTFATLMTGTSTLDFVGNVLPGGGFLGDALGNDLLTLTAPGSVTIRPPASSVPEPGTFALLALGLAGLSVTQRKRIAGS